MHLKNPDKQTNIIQYNIDESELKAADIQIAENLEKMPTISLELLPNHFLPITYKTPNWKIEEDALEVIDKLGNIGYKVAGLLMHFN